MKKLTFWLVPLALLAASCGTPEPATPPSATPSPSPFPSQSATPTVTPVQTTLTATPLLIDGILTSKVNVRSGPGIAYDSLGQLEAGGKIQVIAQDSSGTWYLILFSGSPKGLGWVNAQYVTIPAETEVPLQATPTLAGPTGHVLQRLNVRSGPGTTFNALGLLEPGAAVSLTGKNTTASWFQIDYSGGPGGHGWVTAQYVHTDAAGELPVLDDFGNIVTPGTSGTPSGPHLVPTPTIGPAIPDGDSAASPSINVTFSTTGTRRFIYSGQVSDPQGDAEDWLAFIPFSSSGRNARLIFSLTCTGNGTLTVELWQGGNMLSGWGTLGCGDERKTILLPAGQKILMHLAPVPGNGLRLVTYTLDVQNNPLPILDFFMHLTRVRLPWIGASFLIYNKTMKRTSRHYLFLLLSIFCLLPVVSCARVSSQQEWTIADLRVLDPVDNTASPSTDILAVYTRTIGFDLEIRVDLLDLVLIPDYHLQILLDTLPGGNPWDLVIDIPAEGRPTVTPVNTNLIPRVIRDPWLDTVTVRINRKAIPRSFSLKVISFVAGGPTPADETVSARSDAIPPTQRTPLALVFWDVFPGATPAQALRLLDGAHTGPRGERHGLKHILDSSGQYGIPVALLDLKTPASLAALNYLGILPQIQNLVSRNLLILPDVDYANPANMSLRFSRLAAAGFDLPASQFVYSSSGIRVDYLAQFFPLENATQLARSGRTRLIPLPAADEIQATQDGPSLDVRRALVNAAFSGNSTHLVVLGGDLPLSTWGNEDMAGPTFAWLAAHPWIQSLTGEDLITFPVALTNGRSSGSTSVPSSYLVGLISAPNNSLTDSAWQTYFMLNSPTNDEKLKALRVNYLGQVGELLAAARWAEHPSINTECDQDLNGDGQLECVISNLKFFAILNPAGALMTNLFYLDSSGPHQLVSPSSQFTIGLSDPSEWHPDLGQAADPSVIPGAFSDNTQTWMVYAPEVRPGRIEFTIQDASRIKTYKLLENGIEITYRTSGPVSTRIPLALDPQAFYFEPTGYTGSLTSTSWTWRQTNGIQVEVATDTPLSVESFTDSLPYLFLPENPDRGYPAGHYLPFPLSIVDIQGSGNLSVQIIVK